MPSEAPAANKNSAERVVDVCSETIVPVSRQASLTPLLIYILILFYSLLESTTFPGAKDTRERAGNTGKFLSLVPTLGISHSGEKSRENIGFPECFQKAHVNYYNFPCVMIPECFKGTHRNYYSLPCVLISECFKGTHGNLL